MKYDKDHIHMYKRVDLGRNKEYLVYRCMLPGCPHHIPVHMAPGRKALCWSCLQEMTLDAESLSKVKPTHPECRKTRRVIYASKVEPPKASFKPQWEDR